MQPRNRETLLNPYNMNFVEYFPSREESIPTVVLHFCGGGKLTLHGEDATATWEKLARNFMVGGIR